MAEARRKQIEAMLAEDPDDAFLRYGLAMEYVSEGNHEEALSCLQDLVRVAPNYVPAYQQAGQALQRLDREEEARTMYRAGITVARKEGNTHAADEMERFLDAIS